MVPSTIHSGSQDEARTFPGDYKRDHRFKDGTAYIQLRPTSLYLRPEGNRTIPNISLSLLYFMVLSRQVSGLIAVGRIFHTLEHTRVDTREFGNTPHCRTPYPLPRLINLTMGIGVEIFRPPFFQAQALISRILQHPFQRDVGYPRVGMRTANVGVEPRKPDLHYRLALIHSALIPKTRRKIPSSFVY